MKNIARGISEFSEIIENNYIYIDKTEYIYDLFSRGDKYYFLSRPRRFGKSLLISTFKELFLANKKLFKNLWIEKSNYNWQEYPVIHIDLSLLSESNVEDFKERLYKVVNRIAKIYKIDLFEEIVPADALIELVEKLSKKNKVVILVDEYDKPILDHISNFENAKKIRDYLGSFYSVIKALDKYLKFVFITGVTKFSKASIFSGLNNLNDISLKPEAGKLLGYTEGEIKDNFKDYLVRFSKEKNIEIHELLNKIKLWYNGYRFCEKEIKVYNPFSVAYCLNDMKFSNYWFASGTPSFLISLLKVQYYTLIEIPTGQISSDSLGTFEINNIPLVPLLFQTGYLTIESYNEESDKFILNFPNYEVEESFKKFIVVALTGKTKSEIDTNVSALIKFLNTKEMDNFCSTLQILFANIPYSLMEKKESYFHSLFQFLMSLISLEAKSELLTNVGRIDMVLEMKDYIYIFELKLNSSPEKALEQIHQRKYYERFLDKKKEIILVGISFKFGNKAFSVKHKTETLIN